MAGRTGLLALALVLVPALASAARPLVVRHNFTAQQNHEALSYEEELLRLVLDKTVAARGPYELVRVSGISQVRAFKELDGGGLDVVSTMTSREREAAALPVRYCIYKGLLGVRIGLGLPAVVRRLEGLHDRAALAQVKFGGVFDWPDVDIWHEAQLDVVKLADFSTGVRRLKLGSFELLPLGVVEAAPIAADQGLALIESWVLAYPTAYYYFVNRRNQALAQRLSEGFEAALRDGSFEKLFERRVGALVRAARLPGRRVFLLPNHDLPPGTPVRRRELWHPLAVEMFPEAFR
jgi:hypothetical protein